MAKDLSHINVKKGVNQIPQALKVLLSTPAFITKHKLWRGVFENTWVLIFSIITALLFTYILYNNVHDYFVPSDSEGISINYSSDDSNSENETNTDLLRGDNDELKDQNVEELAEEKDDDDYDENNEEEDEVDTADGHDNEKAKAKKHKPLFSGSLKFLLLIFMELVIFHFAVKTNNILKHQNKVPRFKDFSKAQMRIFKVMGRKWVYGLIMYTLVSIICAITNTTPLKHSIMFLIYGYYMGFAFLDNYLEQFKFTINESASCIQSHFGAALVFGLFTSVVMNVPVVGPLLVPFVCGIAATRYGHMMEMESFPRVLKKNTATDY